MKKFTKPNDQLFAQEAGYCLFACSPLKKTRIINKEGQERNWKGLRVYQASAEQFNFLSQDVANGDE